MAMHPTAVRFGGRPVNSAARSPNSFREGSQSTPFTGGPGAGAVNPAANRGRAGGTAGAVGGFGGRTVNSVAPGGAQRFGGAPVNSTQPGTSFGPGNNLINRQFTPSPSGRQRDTAGQVNQARNAVSSFKPERFRGVGPGQAQGSAGGVNLGGARGFQQQAAQNVGGAQVGGFQDIGGGDFGPAADTGAARAGISTDLASLRGGPSRSELASQTFNQIRESGDPAFQQDLQNVGRRAAALGRIGAGQTTSELGDVLQNRERDLDLVRRGLATESAGQEIGDRFNRLQATQGAAGQLFGQDVTGSGVQQGLRQEQRGERGERFGQELAGANLGLQRADRFAGLGGQEAGFQGQELGARERERAFQSAEGFGLRGEARGERDTQNRFGQQDFQNRLAQLGAASGLEAQQFGQERSNRDELRGERQFQTGRDETATDRRIQQRLLEEQLLNSQFGRNARDRDVFAGVGFNNSSARNLSDQQQFGADRFGEGATRSADAAAGAFGNIGFGRGQPAPRRGRRPDLSGLSPERRANIERNFGLGDPE